jgi:hypothetical protein
MDHLKGARKSGDVRLGFDCRVRLEFHGSKISSDGGLLLYRELDEVLGLHDVAGRFLKGTRKGLNCVHTLIGLLRQSVFGRLAGYKGVNDANRLALDPVMRQIVGGRAVDAQAASASQMGRFETEVLALSDNRAALADVSGQWIDALHDCKGLKLSRSTWTALSALPTVRRKARHGTGTSATCATHPLFIFNQFGHLERSDLRNGNVHSADGWKTLLAPEFISRYAGRDLMRFFRGDAAFAIPELHQNLEAAGYYYAIRLKKNVVLESRIAHRLTRPVGRPSKSKVKSWDKPRRVVAKIEWHPDDLVARLGFIVTNLPVEPDWIIRFYNLRDTAEQHIKEGRQAGHHLPTGRGRDQRAPFPGYPQSHSRLRASPGLA